jgi:hypothetical protein
LASEKREKFIAVFNESTVLSELQFPKSLLQYLQIKWCWANIDDKGDGANDIFDFRLS